MLTKKTGLSKAELNGDDRGHVRTHAHTHTADAKDVALKRKKTTPN